MNLDDIERNGYTFTDGCGYVSEVLASLIRDDFSIKEASVFQIRIAGAKGVVMIKKNMPPGVHLQLRKSQIKFPSQDLTFNVVRCGTLSQGYLNRQLILMLHCLGVSSETFLEMQNQAKEYASIPHILKQLKKKSEKIKL